MQPAYNPLTVAEFRDARLTSQRHCQLFDGLMAALAVRRSRT